MEPKELVEEFAKALVGKPEEVQVNEMKGSLVTVLELNVAREDIGKVVGRGGRIAMAMRTILEAVARKAKHNVILEIVQ
jgi:hypothetical protein